MSSRLFFYNLNISNGNTITNIGSGNTNANLNLTGNTFLTQNVTIGSNVIVNGPTLQIPTGNIASRPITPQNGSIRYNTETQQFEGYGPGGAWGSLGGVIDIAQTTKVLASATPSTTDGNLYFFTTGTERMRINSSGNIGIGTTIPSSLLDVAGTIRGNTVLSTNITTTNLLATNFTASNFSANNVNYGITSVFSGSFSASNNTSTPTNITGFNFSNSDVRSFQASVTISVSRSSGGNLYQSYIFDGFQTDSGWSLYTSNIGDNTGIAFTITSQGQIQYTSTNLNNFISNTIRFSVSQIANTGSYNYSSNLTQGTLLLDSIQIQNTKNSIIGTDPGSLYVLGGSTFQKGINILTTENTIGLGTGGGLTILGGGSISKDLFVGGTISTSNLSLSNNLNVAGTLTVVNITSTNLMDTNLTAGTARITSNLIATGNSNTLGSIFTTGANIGIGTTSPSTTLDIIGIIKATGLQINDVTNAFMPRGGIIMWSGSIASIPNGWLLCDGTNGTPDLRNRFIVGAGTTYTVSTTGGSTTQTLTEANMPTHSHSGTTDADGTHNHTGTTGFMNQNASHSHSYNDRGYEGIVNADNNPDWEPAGDELNAVDYSRTTGATDINHTHNFTTSTVTNHTHTFTTNSKGSGTAFNIIPPYYALAYIMKL